MRRILFAVMGLMMLGFGAPALADGAGDSGYGKSSYGCLQEWIKNECQPGDLTPTARQLCLNKIAKECTTRSFRTTVAPHFLILSLIYAAPGCGATTPVQYRCRTRPSVDYTASSTIGTRLGISSSLKNSATLAASVALSDGGVPFGNLSGGPDWMTTANAQTISFSENAGVATFQPGPADDGVSYKQDFFQILLNPLVILSGVERKGLGHYELSPMYWNVGYDGPAAIIVSLNIYELRHPETISPDKAKLLAAYGWTGPDYQMILGRDPISNGRAIDPARFLQQSYSVPYGPALASDCAGGTCICPYFQYPLAHTSATDTSSFPVPYNVDAKVKFGGDVAAAILNTSASLTVTNSATTENSAAKENVATLQLGCASPAWSGASVLDVYWDTFYGTFLFAPHAVTTVGAVSPSLSARSLGRR